jgi:hypothetical protein
MDRDRVCLFRSPVLLGRNATQPETMSVNLFTNNSFDWITENRELERPDTLPSPIKYHRRDAKRRQVVATRKEVLKDFLKELPATSETIHVVSNGSFDYWNFVPVCLDLAGTDAAEFYGSTWTMNRGNAKELLGLYGSGRIKQITLLSGLYFKRRESAVYATIASGLIDRKQRFLCLENHAKVILLRLGDRHIVIEGSANFTANPRIEQNTITDDAGLYQFHKAWMDGLFKKK